MKVLVNNEYDKLKSVVVSSAEYFDPSTLALNNETIKFYALNGGVPTKEDILKEQKNFWNVLEANDVELLVAKQVKDSKGQMFTRDLAFVIGNKFFISSMKKENRRKAIEGWQDIIDSIEGKVIRVPSNIFLEGGDVVVDGKDIYVGISERTTMEGISFLEEALGSEYNVIPLILNPKFLHLDVVFTIIGPSLALVYKDGLEQKSYELLSKFNKILLTEEEQFKLGTNVFVIGNKKVIINSEHNRIIDEVKKMGLQVLPVNFSETSKDGGAFRCTTCPIEREE